MTGSLPCHNALPIQWPESEILRQLGCQQIYCGTALLYTHGVSRTFIVGVYSVVLRKIRVVLQFVYGKAQFGTRLLVA